MAQTTTVLLRATQHAVVSPFLAAFSNLKIWARFLVIPKYTDSTVLISSFIDVKLCGRLRMFSLAEARNSMKEPATKPAQELVKL